MRRAVCAFILLALICGLPVSLALGGAGNSSVTVTVSATPVIAPSPPPPRDNGVPPEVVPELPSAPERPPVLSPSAFSVSNLFIQPAEVQPKEAITITVSVANTGGIESSYRVVLKINGVKEAEKWVTVAAGSSEIVTFTVTREEVGSYDVAVAGLTASFTVVAPLVPPVPPPMPTPVPAPPVEPAPPEVKPPANWTMVGGIIAGVVAVGLLTCFLVRRKLRGLSKIKLYLGIYYWMRRRYRGVEVSKIRDYFSHCLQRLTKG